MDDQMQTDTTSKQIQSRKRSMRDRELDSDAEEFAVDDELDTPSKRFQDRRGSAVGRHTVHYNAQALLNSLAFKRVFVTSNFSNFHPTDSPVILCFLEDRHDMYTSLCQALPSLYSVSPKLQAIAIATPNAARLQPFMDESLARKVPIIMEEEFDQPEFEDLERFRKAVELMFDGIAVFDTSKRCVWTNRDYEAGLTGLSQRSYDQQSLGLALMKALGASVPQDTMDVG